MSERERIAELRQIVPPLAGALSKSFLGEALDGWQRALDERDEAAANADGWRYQRDRAVAEAAMLREALVVCNGEAYNGQLAGHDADASLRDIQTIASRTFGSAPLAAAAARVIACAEDVRDAFEQRGDVAEGSIDGEALTVAVDALRAAREGR